jgi:beta-lactamase superfamily II metal-dependent hydrolase
VTANAEFLKNMSVKIHFLNTGSGDCTIVHFPERRWTNGRISNERIMMVDLNHSEDHNEYEHIIDYYKHNFRDANGYVKPIFRFICSHPHHDHFCGLNKLLESGINIENFWDLIHDFEPESFDGHSWHKDDWEAYNKIRNGNVSNVTIIRAQRENESQLYWNDKEDRIKILSPSASMIYKAHYKEDGTRKDSKDVDIDSISYALAIQINSKKIILAGDGKDNAWQDIYDNCKNSIKNCNILKAGHHGQECAFHEDATKLMNPDYIIFSNSGEEDKNYGAENLYKKVIPRSEIYKTHKDGTIIATVPYDDNAAITFDFAD